MEIATMRRLGDELNIEASLEPIYHFCYTAGFGDVGAENELCHVYLGRVIGKVQPNDSEISGIRFVAASEIQQELSRNPERFTPWFKQEWQELTRSYSDALSRYCDQT